MSSASIAGRYGFPNRSPYAATKWGVIGLTKTLAMELGEWGIRANAIAPGAVEGDRIVRVFPGAGPDQRPFARGGEGGCAGGIVDQDHDRSERHRAACGVRLHSGCCRSQSQGQVIPIDNDRQKA